MNEPRGLLTLALFALSGTVLSATASAVSDAYLWKVHCSRGDTFNTVVHLRMSGAHDSNTESVQIDQKYEGTVRSAVADGRASVTQSLLSSSTRFRESRVREDNVVRPAAGYSFTKAGLVVSSVTDVQDLLRPGQMYAILLNLPPPASAVHVGESLSVAVPNPLVRDGNKVVVSTLIATKRDAGAELLVIKVKFRQHTNAAADPSEDLNVEGVYILDPAAGFVSHMEFNVRNLPVRNGVRQDRRIVDVAFLADTSRRANLNTGSEDLNAGSGR